MIRSRSMTDRIINTSDAAKAVQMANNGKGGSDGMDESELSAISSDSHSSHGPPTTIKKPGNLPKIGSPSRKNRWCGSGSDSEGGTRTPRGGTENNCLYEKAQAMKKMSMKSIFAVFLCCLFFYSAMFDLFQPLPLEEHKRPVGNTGSVHARELTVVLNTFKRPPQMLDDAVEYYAQCDLVKHVKIVWSEQALPPARLTAKYAKWKMPMVAFERHDSDSLNNRFKPLQTEHTDAIFAVDDDMRVPCQDLDTAFEVWQHSPMSLVGFMPRVHLRKNGLLEYRCWWRVWWHGVYSIILTKAAIYNHAFHALYITKMPKEILEFIDLGRNCEDIAMQFLIANETRLPPIYVKGHLQDLGVLGGISTSRNIAKAAHMDGRSACLNKMEEVYHGVPLLSSRIIVDSANNGWANAPSSWWEFISSDLWAGFWT